MLKRNSQNPFEILRLPNEATSRDVVERGRERAEEVSAEESVAVREAVESLIRDPLQRIEQELFTFYGADYECEGSGQ